MAIEAGRVLNQRYRLIRPVGQGSQASVWVAEHLALQTHVAVKLIDPELAKKETARERFRREATAAAQLRSAHVVQILDHGIDGDQPFIVMELLDGEDLFERLAHRGRLSLRETSKIVTQVARALSRAHAAGIVHRDLKPENVFLCPNEDDEVVKVLDFGVAKVKDAARVTMQKTNVGTLIGTPHYMSPEQVKGIGEIDYHTDLWALGVIAFQCVTGEMPFDSEGVGDLLIKISMGEIPIPSRVYPGVPGAFDGWFAKACERDTQKRFQSARELALALAAVVNQVDGTVPRAPTVRPPAATLPGGLANALPPPAKVPSVLEVAPAAEVGEDFEEIDPFDEDEDDRPTRMRSAEEPAPKPPSAPRPGAGASARPQTAVGLAPPRGPASGSMAKGAAPRAAEPIAPKSAPVDTPRAAPRAPAGPRPRVDTPAPRPAASKPGLDGPASSPKSRAPAAPPASTPPRAMPPAAAPAEAAPVQVRVSPTGEQDIVDFDETIPATDGRLAEIGFPLVVRADAGPGESPVPALTPLSEPPRAPSPPPPAPAAPVHDAGTPGLAQAGSQASPRPGSAPMPPARLAPVLDVVPQAVIVPPQEARESAPVAPPRPAVHPPRPPARPPSPALATTAPVEVESPSRVDARFSELPPDFNGGKRRRLVRWLVAVLVLGAVGVTATVLRSQLDAISGSPGSPSSTPTVSATQSSPPPPPPSTTATTTASAVDPGRVTHPTKPGPTYRGPSTGPTRPRYRKPQPSDGTVEIPHPADDDSVPPAP